MIAILVYILCTLLVTDHIYSRYIMKYDVEGMKTIFILMILVGWPIILFYDFWIRK
jgi:hypothetical protein